MTLLTEPGRGVEETPQVPARVARAELRHKLVTAAAFVVLAGVVPATLVPWQGSDATTTNIVLGLALVIYSAARLSWTLCQQRTQFLSMICFVFIYIFVAIASLAQLVSNTYPLDNRDYAAAAVTHQLGVLLIGCLALEVGLQLAARRRTPTLRRAARSPLHWSFSPGRTVAVSLIGLAVVGYQVLVHGVGAFFVSREMTSALLAGVDPETTIFYQSSDKALGLISTVLSQFIVFITLFVILYSRRHRLWQPPQGLGELGWWALILALVVANVIMNNPIGNGRLMSGIVLGTFVSVYVDVGRRRNLVVYALAALVGLLFLFTYLDYFRSTTRPTTVAASTHGLSSESYPVLQMGLNGDEYVETAGHTLGRQLVGALAAPVPRRFWPGKPIPTGQVVDPQYARSASAWTEMYVDFGLPGVVVFFVGYGYGIRVLEERYHLLRPGVVTAIIPILGVFQLFLLRGSFQPAIGTLYQLVGVGVLVVSVRRQQVPR